MSYPNLVQRLSELKIQYESGKRRHDKWLEENQSLVGEQEYEEYVREFQTWEAGMLKAIEESQEMIRRRPIDQIPTLPQDLDGQLYALLENIPRAKFTKALVELCKQDVNVFNIITEIVSRETKGTGYHNSLLPNANRPGFPVMQPSFPPVIQLPGMGQSYIQYNAPSTSSMQAVPPLQSYQTPYRQMTPYGMIPSDWTIDEPVKRKKPQTPPARDFGIKLPFNDFTQG